MDKIILITTTAYNMFYIEFDTCSHVHVHVFKFAKILFFLWSTAKGIVLFTCSMENGYIIKSYYVSITLRLFKAHWIGGNPK